MYISAVNLHLSFAISSYSVVVTPSTPDNSFFLYAEHRWGTSALPGCITILRDLWTEHSERKWTIGPLKNNSDGSSRVWWKSMGCRARKDSEAGQPLGICGSLCKSLILSWPLFSHLYKAKALLGEDSEMTCGKGLVRMLLNVKYQIPLATYCYLYMVLLKGFSLLFLTPHPQLTLSTCSYGSRAVCVFPLPRGAIPSLSFGWENTGISPVGQVTHLPWRVAL